MCCTIEPIEPTRRVEALAPTAPLGDLVSEPLEPSTAPYATFASQPTGYEPYPALLDPAAASLAAAASAQHLKSFWQSVPPRERRR